MRPVTPQTRETASMASTASSSARPWPPYATGMVIPISPRLDQLLDVLPGILLALVPARRPLAELLRRRARGRRLDGLLLVGQWEGMSSPAR